ncbi:MAG: glycosyltransferase family 39 protein [Candidatus Aminicenantes bacterium]
MKKIKGKHVFLFLFIIFLLTRIIYIHADPPQYLSESLGAFFDEGIYNHNARNLILFGQWKLDEWNDFYYSAVSTWLKYLTFSIIGIGRAQIRLFSIFFSMLSLWFIYAAAKESYGQKTGLLALLLFGINFISIMYARLGMQDTQTLTVFIIGFYLWQKGMKKTGTQKGNWLLFFSGAVFFLSYTFKNLFLYLLPVPIVAYGFYSLLCIRCKDYFNKLCRGFVYLCTGMLSAFFLWFFAFYLPFKEPISQFGKFFTTQQMFPEKNPAFYLNNLYRTFLFKYISGSPAVLLGSFLFLFMVLYWLYTKKKSRFMASDVFLVIWFAACFLFLGLIGYRPTRYFLPIIPVMCVMAARFLVSLYKTSKIKRDKKAHWSFYPLGILVLTILFHRCVIPWSYRYLKLKPSDSFPFVYPGTWELIVSFFLALILTGFMAHPKIFKNWREIPIPKFVSLSFILILLLTSIYLEGKHYIRWAASPEYFVHNLGKDIEKHVGESGYIGGIDAPGAAFDTPYKVLISYDKYVNYKQNPITKYGLTHLFLVDNRDIHEKDYYFQKYPEQMKCATLLDQYHFNKKNTEFYLYSLVDPKIFTIRAPDIISDHHDPLKVKVRMKNCSFREPKKLYLNWLLFPQETLHSINPVVSGEEIRSRIPPQTNKEFTLIGNPPSEPGRYKLFIYWEPIKEYHYPVTGMTHQVGSVVGDNQAVGGKALYHNPEKLHRTGFLCYGNYRSFQPGLYEALFRLKIGEKEQNLTVIRLEAVSDFGRNTINKMDIHSKDFIKEKQYQSFILPFRLEQTTKNLELRIFTMGKTEIWADDIQIRFRAGEWNKDILIVE